MNSPLARMPMHYLIATFALVLAPLCLRFSPWLTLALATLLLWRAWITYKGKTLPPTSFSFLLALGLFLLIWLEYHSLIGRQGGVAALASLATLKLFETRSQRDVKVISLLAYFLVGAGFLSVPSQWMLLWSLLAMLAITGQLMLWQSPQPWPSLGKQLAFMLCEALPLALLLFVFFPRMPPLWSMPDEQTGARTGLSDEMRPGNFSQLARDESIAFRVEFDSRIPKPSARYWRGPVFDLFDGEAWLQVPLDQVGGPSITASGPSIGYTITMEPHNRNWLLAMDIPSELPETGLISNRLQAVNSSPITQRQRYHISSFTTWRTSNDDTVSNALQLPKFGNPQTRKLAASWQALPPLERVNKGLQFLKNGGFSYTLQPPLSNGRNGIDDFLFIHKQGFCEHYASSFTFLMRAAGVPSRVVGGYQGGEWNTRGKYLMVRQANAHAWTEVWLAQTGWQRVDPTAVIAPSRIDNGLASNLGQTDTLPFMEGAPPAWMHELRLNWDSLINGWNQWVMGYDTRKQLQLFKQLGIPDILSSEFIVRMLVAMSLVLTLLFLLAMRSPPSKRDPASQAWRQFTRKLARKGCSQHAYEGPLTFSLRASLQFPQHHEAIHYITHQYIASRYGKDSTSLLKLQKAVRYFSCNQIKRSLL
jgi:protein-glutamine gamma-glutamyltransferase